MRSIPFRVWRLTIAYALMMAGASMMVLVAGIIGIEFAPSESLATLPIALAVVGVAVATLPTGKLMQRFGRREVFLGYAVLAISAALAASLSLVLQTFAGFCLAAFLIGWAGAAGHQYRFAALELVPIELAPKATGALLVGGILGAFIGPELAVRGRHMLTTEYAGSFLLLAWGYSLGFLMVSRYREPVHHEQDPRDGGRPLAIILRHPAVVLAICSAAVAYGVMSFLMVATPISMHQHAGHSLESIKWVIQSHIAAMYLPSLIFAPVLARFGFRVVLWFGVIAYVLTLIIALAGVALPNYWLALVVLGIGWNFLFLGGTNLLPLGYRRQERFRVQSFNDFLTFTVQALVSLCSGWFLFHVAWPGMLWTAAGLLLIYGVVLYRSKAFDVLGSPPAVTDNEPQSEQVLRQVDFDD